MTAHSFENLKREVESRSVAHHFSRAVLEWDVVELEENPQQDGACVCGQQNLKLMFTIHNRVNDADIYPIGSQCVHHFERKDLNERVSVLSTALKLRKSFLNGENVTVTSEYFTKALLGWLQDEGAFGPDQYNGQDPEGDHSFLIKMFNKRDKSTISRPQNSKAHMLLTRKVRPFVQGHESLT